ncbi:MAG: hypothetical protein Q7J35_03430 [Candidatus Methanoperedens sp.]|nr:hypothetical protein [Candidatus Methanoperedens sp.]
MTGKLLEEWQKNCKGCKYYDEDARNNGEPSCTSVNKIETDASGKACLNFVVVTVSPNKITYLEKIR